MARKSRRESDVLSSVRSLLKARGILHFRRGVGGMENPKGQYVAFGMPGEADIEAHFLDAFASERRLFHQSHIILWIECKSAFGKQSSKQRRFQMDVESYGEKYLLVRSADELEQWIRANV